MSHVQPGLTASWGGWGEENVAGEAKRTQNTWPGAGAPWELSFHLQRTPFALSAQLGLFTGGLPT